MPNELKLNVFTIALREKNKPQSALNWSTLDSHLNGENSAERFKSLFIKYIEHFDNKFIMYKNWNKAINISKGNVTFASDQRYIYGFIEGGYTNIASTIKSMDNVNEEGIPVTRNHVTAIPFYFILWIPENSNRGLLITQGIGDRVIHDPFKFNFKKFIESLSQSYHLVFNEHTTRAAIDAMRKGSIKKLTLRKSGLASDRAERVFNKKYNIQDEMNIEINITGFGNKTAEIIKEFMTGNTPDLLEYESFKKVGLDDGFDVLAKFEHGGKSATAKYNTDLELSPVYYIDKNDVPLNESNHPNEDKIKEYLISFLAGMKTEIGF